MNRRQVLKNGVGAVAATLALRTELGAVVATAAPQAAVGEELDVNPATGNDSAAGGRRPRCARWPRRRVESTPVPARGR